MMPARSAPTPSRHGLGTLPPERTGLGLQWAALLGTTALLALWSWLRTEGTIFADAVEYLERALAFSRGTEVVDAAKIRAAGVTLMHAPALWLADLLGVEDTRWVFPYAAFVHAGITCLFVVSAVRLGRRVAAPEGGPETDPKTGPGEGLDRDQGLAAGWFAGIIAMSSATLLRFSAVPMTDIAAGAAVAFGLERSLFGAPTARRGAQGGLAFGLALLAAFKSIPIVVVAAVLAVMGRLLTSGVQKTLGFGAAGLGALSACIFLQCWFDGVTYGRFGIGLWNYVISNATSPLGDALYRMGFVDLGQRIYHFGASTMVDLDLNDVSRKVSDLKQVDPAGYYLANFHRLSPLWLAPLFGLGVLMSLLGASLRPGRRFRARLGLMVRLGAPLLAGLVLAAISTRKGTKELRIWLPLLPIYAAYGGYGARLFCGPAAGLGARWRGALLALGLVAAPLEAVSLLAKTPATTMGALARAAEWLSADDRLKELSRSGSPARVTSSYHWSALFRTAPHLELVKLPNQLDGSFAHLETAEERKETLEALASMDAVIVHSSLLRVEGFQLEDPTRAWAREILEVLQRFHVAAAFWERATDEAGFGPILVLMRGAPEGAAFRPLAILEPLDEDDASPSLVRMERPLAGTVEEVDISRARAWQLPGDGLYWIEVALDQRGPDLIADYILSLKVADATGTRGFTEIRRPLWNKRPMKGLPGGSRLREGFVVAPDQGPASRSAPASTLRPGESAWVFLDVATVNRSPAGVLYSTGRLEPLDPSWRGAQGAQPGTIHAERDDLIPGSGAPGGGVTDDGFVYAAPFGELRIGELVGSKVDATEDDGDESPGTVLQVEAVHAPK